MRTCLRGEDVLAHHTIETIARLDTSRARRALTTVEAADLLERLPPLARAMVALGLLSGLRRGELFALRWKDLNEQARVLTVREAVYEGTFGTPKTEAGRRQIPLCEGALQAITEWRRHVKNAEPDSRMGATFI